MTYDLRMALVECISVMGEHIEPGSGYPHEVLQRARKLADVGEWLSMVDAPLDQRLIIADPVRDVMAIWELKSIMDRVPIADAGWTLYRLAPDMPEVQP